MVRMLLLPSLGPFHILHPRYNAATVLVLLERARPEVLYLASLSPEDLKTGRWREEDPLLFHLLPWAEERGCPWWPWTRRPTSRGRRRSSARPWPSTPGQALPGAHGRL